MHLLPLNGQLKLLVDTLPAHRSAPSSGLGLSFEEEIHVSFLLCTSSASLHPLLRLLLISWSVPVEGWMHGLTVCTRAQLGLSL